MRSQLFRGRLICAMVLCSLWPTASFGQLNSSPLVPEATAQRVGLVRAWWRQAPVDITRDRVENFTLQGDTLYVQTKRGTISALDAENGQVRWTKQVGSPDLVTTSVGASDKYAAVANGSKLYVLTHDKGELAFEPKKLRNVPGAGPAICGTHVFAPTINGSIEAYDVEDPKQPPQIYTSTGRAMTQPFSAGTTLAWNTDRGLFYVAMTEPLAPRFRVETNEPIIVGPGYQPPYLYVGSMDGHVMKVHELTGSIVWKAAVGEPVDSRLTVLENQLFVSSRRGGLRCVLAESKNAVPKAGEVAKEMREGAVMWHAPAVGRLLAGSAKRLYCLDEIGRMVILRRDDGGYVDSMPLVGHPVVVLNDVSDRIYVGTPGGTVQCLHEAGLAKPLNHRRDPSKKAAPKQIKQKALDPEAAQEAPKEKAKEGDAEGFGNDLFNAEPKGAPKQAPADGEEKAKEAPPKKAKEKEADDKGGDAFGADPKAEDPKAADPF